MMHWMRELTSSRGFGRVIFGSRFNGYLTASLHAQQRGVPPPYVYRRVHVRMGGKSAMQAIEARLALAASFVDGSAIRTGLGSVRRIDLDQRPAALLQLVGKDCLERAPALVEDRAVKTTLAGAGSGHIDHLQILQDNHAEPLHDAQRSLVVPVSTDAGALGRKLGAAPKLTQAALGPLLAAGEYSLSAAMALIYGAKACWDRKVLTRRERQGIRNAAVNANARQTVGRRLVFDLARKGYMPAERVLANGCALDRSGNTPRISELHPSDFQQTNCGPLRADLSDTDFTSLQPEAFINPLPSGRRVARLAIKKPAICFIQIPQRLGLRHRRNRSNPIKFIAELRQLPALRGEADTSPFRGSILPPEVAPLLKRQIVDQPTHASELLECSLLFCGRRELVAEASKHAGIIS